MSENLLLSDIQLASDIRPSPNRRVKTPFKKNDLIIIPQPFSTVLRDQPFFIYFEVNNLAFEDEGQTAYTVEYKLRAKKIGLAKLNPFSGKKLALSSSYQRNGQKRNEQEYFSLYLKKVKPGDYTLTVRVTDELARVSRESSVILNVVEY